LIRQIIHGLKNKMNLNLINLNQRLKVNKKGQFFN
jgi:hypothetical protein